MISNRRVIRNWQRNRSPRDVRPLHRHRTVLFTPLLPLSPFRLKKPRFVLDNLSKWMHRLSKEFLPEIFWMPILSPLSLLISFPYLVSYSLRSLESWILSRIIVRAIKRKNPGMWNLQPEMLRTSGCSITFTPCIQVNDHRLRRKKIPRLLPLILLRVLRKERAKDGRDSHKSFAKKVRSRHGFLFRCFCSLFFFFCLFAFTLPLLWSRFGRLLSFDIWPIRFLVSAFSHVSLVLVRFWMDCILVQPGKRAYSISSKKRVMRLRKVAFSPTRTENEEDLPMFLPTSPLSFTLTFLRFLRTLWWNMNVCNKYF